MAKPKECRKTRWNMEMVDLLGLAYAGLISSVTTQEIIPSGVGWCFEEFQWKEIYLSSLRNYLLSGPDGQNVVGL